MSKVLTRCLGCTSKLRVPEVYLGKEISCPKCQGTVLVRDIEAAESVPVATPRPVPKPAAKPATPRAVAAPLKVAIPSAPTRTSTPQRVRKPAPVNDVIEDFEEVSDDELFEDLDEYNRPPEKSRGLKNQKKSRAVSLSEDGRPSRRRKSSSGMNGGLMVKGALMIVGAIIWFVVGYWFGWVYYYPPVMLVLGLIAFFKGMFGGEE